MWQPLDNHRDPVRVDCRFPQPLFRNASTSDDSCEDSTEVERQTYLISSDDQASYRSIKVPFRFVYFIRRENGLSDLQRCKKPCCNLQNLEDHPDIFDKDTDCEGLDYIACHPLSQVFPKSKFTLSQCWTQSSAEETTYSPRNRKTTSTAGEVAPKESCFTPRKTPPDG